MQATAFNREGPEPLELPARDAMTLIEGLAVHHEEDPTTATAGQIKTCFEVRLVGSSERWLKAS